MFTFNCLCPVEHQRKQESVNENIAQFHKAKKDNKTELDNISLQRKITEKKITLANNQRSALSEEIHDAKLIKESISLEMVELAQSLYPFFSPHLFGSTKIEYLLLFSPPFQQWKMQKNTEEIAGMP